VETVVEGFDKVPEALVGLLKGENLGKVLIKVGSTTTITTGGI